MIQSALPSEPDLGGQPTTSASAGVLGPRLLAAARAAQSRRDAGAAGAAPPAVPAVEFDWKSPCHFTARQLRLLEDLGRRAAGGMSKALAALVRTDVSVELASATQHYAASLAEPGKPADYALPLQLGDRACGRLALSPEAALGWVDKMLGGSGDPKRDTSRSGTPPGQAEDRPLSPLEAILLSDVMAALAGGALTALGQPAGRSGANPRPASTVTREPVAAEQGGQAYVRLAFKLSVSGAGANREGSPLETSWATQAGLVIASPVMEGLLAGDGEGSPSRPQAAQPAEKTSPEQVRNLMQGYVRQSVIRAQLLLGKVSLRVEQLMSLEPGDVLVLTAAAQEPAELLVAGRSVLAGRLVLCRGRYGLEVVSRRPTGRGEVAKADPSAAGPRPQSNAR